MNTFNKPTQPQLPQTDDVAKNIKLVIGEGEHQYVSLMPGTTQGDVKKQLSLPNDIVRQAQLLFYISLGCARHEAHVLVLAFADHKLDVLSNIVSLRKLRLSRFVECIHTFLFWL